MDHCIVFRWPRGRVDFIADSTDRGDDIIKVFPDRGAAVNAVKDYPILEVCAYQILELDEL